jgi:hypothetical protein
MPFKAASYYKTCVASQWIQQTEGGKSHSSSEAVKARSIAAPRIPENDPDKVKQEDWVDHYNDMANRALEAGNQDLARYFQEEANDILDGMKKK